VRALRLRHPLGLRALALALLFPAALAACNRSETGGAPAGDPYDALDLLRARVVTPAPDFTLPSLGGQPVRLIDRRRQVVLLNFWATWCPPCREEMPSMERLYRRHQDRGFSVVAVSTDAAGAPPVAAFVETLELTFPMALDPDMAVANSYRVQALPTTFIIDREANIVARAVGARNWDSPAAHALIEALLAR
jgi:peroxiredoxin